jgi:ABC-type microcin C transport system permease subunit YejE
VEAFPAQDAPEGGTVERVGQDRKNLRVAILLLAVFLVLAIIVVVFVIVQRSGRP